MIGEKSRRPGAFTLIELLVCMAVIFILAMLLFTVTGTIRDRANVAKCTANLRALSVAAVSYANEHDGMLWSRKDLGNSMYRMAQDERSPATLLSAYVSPGAWICPAAPKTVRQFGNTYTWTIAPQFDTQPVAMVNQPYLTLLFWDAYQYNLPTLKGASEDLAQDGSGKGPAKLPTKNQTKYHAKNTKTNFGYLDGHVETK